jgi:glycyl-tRNA synthetase beta subunit
MSIAINQKDYKLAISIMLLFSPCIDAFFKTVLINAPQEDIRSNRRAIIRRIHKLFIACKVDFEGLNETSLKNLSITQSRIRKLYDSFQKEGQE